MYKEYFLFLYFFFFIFFKVADINVFSSDFSRRSDGDDQTVVDKYGMADVGFEYHLYLFYIIFYSYFSGVLLMPNL
jgi:hypothetical protein